MIREQKGRRAIPQLEGHDMTFSVAHNSKVYNYF